MKKLVTGMTIFSMLIFTNAAVAALEVNNVNALEYKMNFVDQVCTLTIDQDVPTNEATQTCTQRTFSWNCLFDDYLWKMLMHIQNNNLRIDIRYSSDGCFGGDTGNFELLTVW